ncbi:hypothetical protein MHLP_01535 [Candidatus Mycoplasma haematolamae str. Purdue]|uniref:Uncharacterized protein n=1 Tax=Mycoplasma haematolamae (strain Purdue) TaxID=1212765 RepID=I7C5U5_MYCHA|nr:hypothetical protein [Candidatus Mycoplasma haematolamae]AFO51887.1 hypothetical protein MHLP_01535 [Candidatus Mycoplasma haematolamae str. Purdue]
MTAGLLPKVAASLIVAGGGIGLAGYVSDRYFDLSSLFETPEQLQKERNIREFKEQLKKHSKNKETSCYVKGLFKNFDKPLNGNPENADDSCVNPLR